MSPLLYPGDLPELVVDGGYLILRITLLFQIVQSSDCPLKVTAERGRILPIPRWLCIRSLSSRSPVVPSMTAL